MNIKWEPYWYELDQSIVIGDIDLFYLTKDNCYCLQYGAVHSRDYLGREYGIECYDREQTVFGIFHCDGCYIISDFFCGCSVWIYPETFLAASLLRASISVLYSDMKE